MGEKNQIKVEGDQNVVVGRDNYGSVTIQQVPPPALSPLHQMPPPPRDFTGREAELRELKERLGQGVTISGVQGQGGVGKTALALQLAAEIKSDYPDAQFYLDLRGASDRPLTPAEAMARIIGAYYPLAKLPEDDASLRALYLSVLDGQRVLLLMDNAAGREQVEQLIPPLGCALMVTSRWHFALPGLWTKPLDAMTEPEAHTLLLRIAPRIGVQAAAIAHLCGNLPLALRLAASTLAERADLQPAEYARRLQLAGQRLKLIEASLGLSYDLLDDEGQRRWRTLAVFPSSFDVRAAAAVWQIEEEATSDALGELLKASLVDWSGISQRYNLHDLSRVFAEAKLAKDDERDVTKLRHAEHFRRVLAEAKSLIEPNEDRELVGWTLFNQEIANIGSAMRWVMEQMEVDQALADVALAYYKIDSTHLFLSNHLKERITMHELEVKVCQQIEDGYGEYSAFSDLGTVHGMMSEPSKGIGYREKAVGVLQKIGHRQGEVYELANLGSDYTDLGEARKAIDYCEKAMGISREINFREGEAFVLSKLGDAYFALKEPHMANQCYENALGIWRESQENNDQFDIANGLHNWGSQLAEHGDRNRAIELFEQALTIYDQIESGLAAHVRERLAELRGE